jgi:predicted nucleotidyltransferase component of viral defense system
MFTSKMQLLKDANAHGYQPDILEKVYRLLDIFKQLLSVPFLQERLVLKGGTALNLFHFAQMPRLSVDIDLNYIGSLNREAMLNDKPIVTDAIHQILVQNQLQHYRSPMYHAGGKMVWYYNSVLGQRGSLEIDLNFMYRQPLYPIVYQSPNISIQADWKAPTLDIHELAAGKLSALFNRSASRDLFDAHYLLNKINLDTMKLRAAFVVYIAMTNIALSSLTTDSIDCHLKDVNNRLLPVMHRQSITKTLPQLKIWAHNMLQELRESLATLLPLQENEIEFIQGIRREEKILPALITKDATLAAKITQHPALHWAIKKRT